jgi:hypothetical protein
MLKYFNLFRFIQFPFFDGDGGSGGGGEPAPAPDADAEAKKKQEELNKQFAERATRATETERKRLLEELGVKDPEEAKALLKIAREADDKTKTETEKLQKQAQDALDAKTKAETKAEESAKSATKKLMDAEIKINAAAPVFDKDGKKVVRPAFRKEALSDVLLLINREGIVEKDDTFEGVEKALSELAKNKPWLLVEEQSDSRGTPHEERRGYRKGDRDEGRTPIISSL